jgi:hypothetical protein
MQYKMIEPYLKRKTPTPIGNQQLFQSVDDRKKLVCIYFEISSFLKLILLGWYV